MCNPDFSPRLKKEGSKTAKMYVYCKRISAVKRMTPNKNHSIPEQFVFGQVKSCPVVVNLKGEPVTSDVGLTLIPELDRKREITSRFARCFKDYRDPNKVLYPVHNLIAQRIYIWLNHGV